MKGKHILQSLVAEGKPMQAAGNAAPAMRTSGAVKAMGLGLDRLTTEAAEAKLLREQLASIEATQELDPSLFDPSIVRDRIALKMDPVFESLKAAIAENGQQIAIVGRPHPDVAGRYQIAAGHRRCKVAMELGRKVKAIIRPLTDREMMILQGQENGPREALTFIERARFALNSERSGQDRDDIASALSIDKPEVSRLLTVAQIVGEDLMLEIGPARKVGRPRWLKLVASLEQAGTRTALDALIETDVFQAADSDKRFALALEAIGTLRQVKKRRLNTQSRIAWLETKGTTTRLVCGDTGFSTFLQRRLPQLLEEFEASPEARITTSTEGGKH